MLDLGIFRPRHLLWILALVGLTVASIWFAEQEKNRASRELVNSLRSEDLILTRESIALFVDGNVERQRIVLVLQWAPKQERKALVLKPHELSSGFQIVRKTDPEYPKLLALWAKQE